MIPTILFRAGTRWEEEELAIASKYFPVVRYRSELPVRPLVIPRYSALPYYNELVKDVTAIQGRLINSPMEHHWCADISGWGRTYEEFTPRSWDDHSIHSSPFYQGPYVVKGATNSRKAQWKTHMFAATKKEALEVASKLAYDPIIGQQGIYYREYVELENHGIDPISGIPIAHEFRFFFYRETLLARGFYWDNHDLDVPVPQEATEFAQKLAEMAKATFYVLDIAKAKDGRWILIEVNDGQQAGLSSCSADDLYGNLRKAIDRNIPRDTRR